MLALSSLLTVSLLPGHSPFVMRHASPRSRIPLAFVGPDDQDKPADFYQAAAPAMLYEKTPGGLSYKDLDAGEGGDKLLADSLVSISYTATLLSTGEVLEQTSPNRPLTFKRGQARSEVFDEAIEGMKVGGSRRVLVLPSSKWAILDKDTVDFEIKVVEIKTGASAAVYQAGGVARQLARTAFFFLIAQDVVNLLQGVSGAAAVGDAAAAVQHIDVANAWALSGLQSVGLM